MSFLEGLLGSEFGRRSTPQDIVEKEQDRLFSRKVRRQLEQEEELEELQTFLQRQPYSKDDKSRPSTFEEYIGQKDTKEMVRVLIEAVKITKDPLPHSLFWGEAGLGKTTISYLIAKELQANLIITTAGQLETKEELLNIFKQFQEDRLNILFIDEVHAIKRRIAEMLYSAMEDYRFDYTTRTNKVVNLNLPAFTLLGATTDLAKLLIPIRQRFQNRFHLVPYNVDELCQIAKNYLNRIKYYPVSDEALKEVALRSRNIARYSINYVKNLIDYCLVKHLELNPQTVKEYFIKEGIDKQGLTRYDRDYLKVLLNSKDFKAGLNTVVKSIGIDRRTTEQEIEPFLLRKRFIIIGTRGRELTEAGFDYITQG